MGRLLRYAPLALTATAWVLLRVAPVAALAGVGVERVLGRVTIALFVIAFLHAAWGVAGARLRPVLARPRGARAFIAIAIAYAGAYAFLTGLVNVAPGTVAHAAFVTGEAWGPLTAWPHVALAWPALGVTAFVTVGRALVGGAVALVVAATVVLALEQRARARDAAASAGAGSACASVAAACPACPPLLAAALPIAGAASAHPLALALRDPASPASAFLEVAGPALALAALAFVTRDARARTARAPVALALAPGAALALVALGIVPRGASTTQEAIHALTVWITVGAVALTLTVVVLLLLFALKYRDPDGAAPRRDREPSARTKRGLIAAYTLVPAVIILAIGALSVPTLVHIETVPEGSVHVDVSAVRFGWIFRYPDGAEGVNELRVQEDEVVVLTLSTGDVMHSFYVPDLGVKMDALPDRPNTYWFQPVRAGVYQAYCAEFCGAGHRDMLADVVVFPQGVQDKPYGPGTERPEGGG